MVEFISVTSSNIQGIGYDDATKTLHVEFRGGARYTYAGVPKDEYEDFLNAPSKGSYLAENIKDVYPHTRG